MQAVSPMVMGKKRGMGLVTTQELTFMSNCVQFQAPGQTFLQELCHMIRTLNGISLQLLLGILVWLYFLLRPRVRNMRIVVVALVGMVEISQANAADQLWPPKNVSELVGQRACAFPEEAKVGLYSGPVFDRPGFRLDYRHKGEAHQYVLLIKENGKNFCDAQVVSALHLPVNLERNTEAPDESRWSVEFDCRYLGRYWSDNKQAFGIVDQQLPRGYFSPRQAWLVDPATASIRPVAPEQVLCARFSNSGD
jgi:hypothetical protein